MNFIKFAVEVSYFTIFIVILTIVLIAILLGFILFYQVSKNKSVDKMSAKYHAIYKFVVNLRSQKAIVINLKDMNPSEIEFTEFLSYFSVKDQNILKEWLKESLDDKDFDKYRDEASNVFTFEFKNKENNKTLKKKMVLHIIKIDKYEQTLFLTGNLLTHLPIDEKRKKVSKVIFDFSDIKKKYEDGYFAQGSSFIIRFKKKEDVESYYNELQLRYILIDALFKMDKPSNLHFYFRNDNFEINILTKDFINIAGVRSKLDQIVRILDKCFEQYGYFVIYDYAVVGSAVIDLPHIYDEMYKRVNETLDECFDKKIKASLFRKEESVSKKNASTRTEYLKIVRSQGVEPLFRPVIYFKDNAVSRYGELVSFKVNNDHFKDFQSLKKASKSSSESIIPFCLKKAISTYIESRESYFNKIIIPLEFDEIDIALKQLPQIDKIKDAHIIFMIDLNNFLDIDDLDDYIAKIKKVKAKGVEIGILIKRSNFQPKKALFDAVDLLFVDCEINEVIKADSKQFISAHVLLEKVVNYSKTVILINSFSLSEIDLFYRAGISYFSSDAIISPSPMIAPLDRKTTKKLTNMTK